MLAALLLNEPYPGGAGKSHDEEKADRYLKTLRKEHFERQRVKEQEPTEAVKKAAFVAPVPQKIEETIETSDNLRLVADEDDDALALLLIIAQL